MAAVYRALAQYKELAPLVSEIEFLSTDKFRDLTKKLSKLFESNASNFHWQAFNNLGTAGLCLAANAILGPFGFDSLSANTIMQKFGEVPGKVLQSSETSTQGNIKETENKLGQGPNKAHKELYDHFAQAMRSMIELNGQTRRTLAGG